VALPAIPIVLAVIARVGPSVVRLVRSPVVRKAIADAAKKIIPKAKALGRKVVQECKKALGGRQRGLPPRGHTPPPVNGPLRVGPASRSSEAAKGGKSLWDKNGGEWRYAPADKYHNPHWDYNPHIGRSSPWQNIKIGNLPPHK
jgi:hypothetical protein